MPDCDHSRSVLEIHRVLGKWTAAVFQSEENGRALCMALCSGIAINLAQPMDGSALVLSSGPRLRSSALVRIIWHSHQIHFYSIEMPNEATSINRA